MKRDIIKILIILILCFFFLFCMDNRRPVLAQFLPSFGGFPYYAPFSSSLIGAPFVPPGLLGLGAPYYAPVFPSLIRPSGFAGRYQGFSPVTNMTQPLANFPQPIVRRFNALTTLTTIKVLLPAGATTVVLNPFSSPVVVPLTSLTIPVTPTQAQPILLAAGLTPLQTTPTSVVLFSFLTAPSLSTILPPSIAGLLTIVP